jgi:hypothetical protein
MNAAGYNERSIRYIRYTALWQWIILAVSVVLNITLWTLVLWLFPKDTPVVILHYSVGVGVDFIGQSRQIMVLPLIGTVILGANSILAWAVGRASDRAAWMFLGITPIIHILLIMAFIVLWRLNV